jgi:hypothetical protein
MQLSIQGGELLPRYFVYLSSALKYVAEVARKAFFWGDIRDVR